MALKDLKWKTWVDRRRARAINSQIMLVWLVRLVAFILGVFGIPPPFDGLIPGG